MRHPALIAAPVGFALPLVALATAYTAQYAFHLYPCEMCWWQRYAHFAALALGTLAVLLRRAPVGPALTVLTALALLVAGLLGGFHAGVEYHWWEGVTSCSTSRITGDALAAILSAPLVRCDTPAWTLAGISMAGFNFLYATTGAALVLVLLARGGRRAR